MSLFEVAAKIVLDAAGYNKGLEDASKKTNSFGKKVNDGFKKLKSYAVTGLKAASAAAVAFGVSSIKTGMDFDAAMSKVGAISGATGKDMDALRKKAQEMGEKTQFSATESANAFEYMAMAGWKTGDMLNGIEGIMNLAAASGEDLATTSDIVTDALTAFGLAASDSGHFADILAVASSNANTNVSMMGETFKYVAPVAGALGVSAEDTAEAIGLMANAGIKSSQAGTTLRSILTRLSTDAGASSKSLGALGVLTQELGVDFYDSKGKVRDFGDILSEAREQWKTLSAEDASRFAKKIAGQEGISGWLALMNAAPKDIKKLQKAIEECDGAAEDMANARLDNLAGDVTILKSAFEGLQIAVSDKATPSLRLFVQGITNGISELTEFIKNIDFTGETVTQITNDILYMIVGLSGKIREKAGEFTDAGISLIQSIATGIEENGPTLLRTATTIITNFAGVFTDNAPKIVDSLISGIQNNFPKLVESALEAAVKFSEGLRNNAGKIVDAGLTLIMSLANGLIKNIPTLIKTVPTIISNLAGIINDNAPKLIKAGFELIVKLAKGIVDAIPTLVQEIPKIIKAIVDVWTAFNWLSLGTKLITGIVNGVKSIASKIPTAVKSIGTEAVKLFKSIDWLQAGKTVIQFILNGVKAVVSIVPNAVKSIGSNALNLFKSIDWKGVGSAVIDFIKNAATNAGSGVVNAVKAIGTKGISAFRSVDWAGVGRKAIDFLKSAVTSAGHNVASALKTVGTTAMNAFKSLDWKSIGSNIINGIKNGITGGLSAIKNAAENAAKTALNAAKNLLGIQSPSKEFAWVGKMIDQGLAKGIDGNSSVVDDAMSGLASITQLSSSPFIQRASASANGIAGAAAGNNTTSIVMNIYGAQGQDVKALADEVERRLNSKVNRGLVAYA